MPTFAPTTVAPGNESEFWRNLLLNLGVSPVYGGLGGLQTQFVNYVAFLSQVGGTSLGPAGSIGQTIQRSGCDIATVATTTSGTLYLASISLAQGVNVNNFNVITGGTGTTTLTNFWMGLYDSSRKLLAITASITTPDLTSATPYTLPVANTAAGAATTFLTTYTGYYYVGIMVAAAAQATWTGKTVSANASKVNPIIYGSSSTGLSTPSTFPTTAGAITAVANAPYVYLT